MISFLQFVIKWLYIFYQWPFSGASRWREWLADVAPFKADSYAPRGFFEPAVVAPPIARWHLDTGDDTAWLGRWAALCLIPLDEDSLISGMVMFVEVRKITDEWNHETFYMVVPNKYLNRWATSTGHGPVLKVQLPIGSRMPVVGDRINAYGTLCPSLAWGFQVLAMSSAKWERQS